MEKKRIARIPETRTSVLRCAVLVLVLVFDTGCTTSIVPAGNANPGLGNGGALSPVTAGQTAQTAQVPGTSDTTPPTAQPGTTGLQGTASGDFSPSGGDEFSTLLARYVDGQGLVDYNAWNENQADRAALQRIVQGHASADIGSLGSREAQLAFWINAYNAAVLDGILQNYPVDNPQNLDGFFDNPVHNVAGRTLSLNQIENEVIRPTFEEPRIHFALVCAAISCPKLRNEAYTAANLEAALDDQARAFLANPSKNQFSGNTARVSQLFQWYAEDFTRDGTLAQFLQRFASGEAASVLADPDVQIQYLEYDWRLNDRANGTAS